MFQESEPPVADRSLELARTFGESYRSLLRVISDEGSEHKAADVREVLQQFPEELQAFIRQAVNEVVGHLESQEETVRALLKKAGLSYNPDGLGVFHASLIAQKWSQNRDNDNFVFSLLLPHVKVKRFAAGLYHVDIAPEGMKELAGSIVSEIHVGSYLEFVFQEFDLTYAFSISHHADTHEALRVDVLYHELHHLLHAALLKNGSLRDTRESDKNASVFLKFRDEMVGYLLSAESYSNYNWGLKQASDLGGEAAKEYRLSKLIYHSLNILRDGYAQAQTKQLPASVFIYPTLTSRSFEEFERKITKLTQKIEFLPPPKESDDNKKGIGGRLRRLFKGFD